jgi:hypothetical protein
MQEEDKRRLQVTLLKNLLQVTLLKNLSVKWQVDKMMCHPGLLLNCVYGVKPLDQRYSAQIYFLLRLCYRIFGETASL